MGKLYNEVAGRDLDRLNALSDGIFAFAMTLLILDLRVPGPLHIHTEAELRSALLPLGRNLLLCLMTFLTLGIFWVGQQTQLRMFRSSDRTVSWLQIGFLFMVVLMPFSTALLAAYATYRTAILIYWFNILLLGVMLFLSFDYGRRGGLLRDNLPISASTFYHRIIIAQSLYALAAALCFVNTWLSIWMTFAIQLNYAVAPRIGWLYRL